MKLGAGPRSPALPALTREPGPPAGTSDAGLKARNLTEPVRTSNLVKATSRRRQGLDRNQSGSCPNQPPSRFEPTSSR
jgi:hypothetical protein